MDIKGFLEEHKLSNYCEKFVETGNDDLEYLATVRNRASWDFEKLHYNES